MANREQLARLKKGVKAWNKWRAKNPGVDIDLSGANLRGANLNKADLRRADLHGADFCEANLGRANLSEANLSGAQLFRADLSSRITLIHLDEADLRKFNIHHKKDGRIELDIDLDDFMELKGVHRRGADLHGANLNGADLSYADLSYADLSSADLSRTNLDRASLVETVIDLAKISESSVYGVNVWDLKGEFEEQKDLVITPKQILTGERKPIITVDNIKIAQFIYLILNNEEIRDVINTLTSKSVLILGRFTPERKAILDALKNKLREYNLLPIVFDFERPDDRDFTETIQTLAGLCYFVIADITNPKSSPLELQSTVPDYQIPFVPIIQEGEQPFAMMVDLQKKYNWVLDTLSYNSIETLIKALKPAIIDPAIQKHNELRLIKAREPKIRSANDFIDDKGLDNQSNSVE